MFSVRDPENSKPFNLWRESTMVIELIDFRAKMVKIENEIDDKLPMNFFLLHYELLLNNLRSFSLNFSNFNSTEKFSTIWKRIRKNQKKEKNKKFCLASVVIFSLWDLINKILIVFKQITLPNLHICNCMQ